MKRLIQLALLAGAAALIACIVTLFSAAIARAYSEEPTAPAPVVTTPPVKVPVVQEVPELPMPTQVNPGARVPVIAWPTAEMLGAACGMPGQGVIGIFHLGENGKPVIWVVGPFAENSVVLTHEFEHYLEAKMPDQAQRLRDCFHDLCSDQAHWDHEDLEAPIVLPDQIATPSAVGVRK